MAFTSPHKILKILGQKVKSNQQGDYQRSTEATNEKCMLGIHFATRFKILVRNHLPVHTRDTPGAYILHG